LFFGSPEKLRKWISYTIIIKQRIAWRSARSPRSGIFFVSGNHNKTENEIRQRITVLGSKGNSKFYGVIPTISAIASKLSD
jgi:hypothetical protein